MGMQDPFSSPAFQMTEMTAAINLLPNSYGRIRQKNLFPVKGVTTRNVIVEERNGKLNLIQSSTPGAPGRVNTRGSRGVRSFVIPHFPLDDFLLPSDIQGVRAFGSQTELEVMSTKVNEVLQGMKDKHDITLEWLMVNALKGKLLDADGEVLLDLHTSFGVGKKTISFALSNPATKVANKCRELLRHIEDNIGGEVFDGVEAPVSAEFFDALVTHPSVEAAYAGWSAAAERIGGDLRKGFVFAGITFSEYRGNASDADGNVRRFIEAGDGHAYPTGTRSTFQTLAAPADFNESVNTIGQLYYAKAIPAKFDRGIDLHTQMNPLPICYRPAVLVELKAN